MVFYEAANSINFQEGQDLLTEGGRFPVGGGKRDLLPLLLTPLHINLKITSTDFVILKNETQQTQHSQKIVLRRVKGGGEHNS